MQRQRQSLISEQQVLSVAYCSETSVYANALQVTMLNKRSTRIVRMNKLLNGQHINASAGHVCKSSADLVSEATG